MLATESTTISGLRSQGQPQTHAGRTRGPVAGISIVRRADQVNVLREEFAEDLPGADRLVARDAQPQAIRPKLRQSKADIFTQVTLGKCLRLA